MTNTNRIAATEIMIHRSEGPSAQCVTVRFAGPGCWAAAERHLAVQSATAPDGGACDKCDVSIMFADGFLYSGRYELHRDRFTSLAAQIGQAWSFYACRGLTARQAAAYAHLKLDRAIWERRIETYAIGVQTASLDDLDLDEVA